MTNEQMRPGVPVLYTNQYAAHAASGRLLLQVELPAGCYSPLIPGVAYYVPLGMPRADC